MKQYIDQLKEKQQKLHQEKFSNAETEIKKQAGYYKLYSKILTEDD